jgi:hypothetical protein
MRCRRERTFRTESWKLKPNPALSRPVKAPPVDGEEWTTMNEDDAHESLLVLIGELLYKNQLLREAIASKDEVIELIINHLMSAATSACSCGVCPECGQRAGCRVGAPKRVLLQRILQYCDAPDRQGGKFGLGRGDQSCRKIEVDPYDFPQFPKRMQILT